MDKMAIRLSDTLLALFGFLAPHGQSTLPARPIEMPQFTPQKSFSVAFHQALAGTGIIIKTETQKARQLQNINV